MKVWVVYWKHEGFYSGVSVYETELAARKALFHHYIDFKPFDDKDDFYLQVKADYMKPDNVDFVNGLLEEKEVLK